METFLNRLETNVDQIMLWFMSAFNDGCSDQGVFGLVFLLPVRVISVTKNVGFQDGRSDSAGTGNGVPLPPIEGASSPARSRAFSSVLYQNNKQRSKRNCYKGKRCLWHPHTTEVDRGKNLIWFTPRWTFIDMVVSQILLNYRSFPKMEQPTWRQRLNSKMVILNS